ncbi:uncharacterized [Tachysurus ichikawai]
MGANTPLTQPSTSRKSLTESISAVFAHASLTSLMKKKASFLLIECFVISHEPMRVVRRTIRFFAILSWFLRCCEPDVLAQTPAQSRSEVILEDGIVHRLAPRGEDVFS